MERFACTFQTVTNDIVDQGHTGEHTSSVTTKHRIAFESSNCPEQNPALSSVTTAQSHRAVICMGNPLPRLVTDNERHAQHSQDDVAFARLMMK